jgi:hypothetical protein
VTTANCIPDITHSSVKYFGAAGYLKRRGPAIDADAPKWEAFRSLMEWEDSDRRAFRHVRALINSLPVLGMKT